MRDKLTPISPRRVRLLPSMFQERFKLNRAYVMSLQNANLLQNYYLEAALESFRQKPEDIHWGWEAPTCQLRGHFLGHWLSGAAQIYAATGDAEAKAKADAIVAELARCQQANGGEWAGSIPEKYLDRIVAGQRIWAPHYTLHKTLMGLYDMYALAGNDQALEILINWARWFHRWTGQFSREQMDDILDVETGGMLEVWANLYGVTGRAEHLELMRRYDRPRLFEPLLAGEDVLTNMHANTTIPEVLGAARAFEVTGEPRWRAIVEAYWRSAVTERGYFATGGQTCGEIWTPPFEQAARLGDKNQEHCTVYNMMLLADRLLRWTGDLSYADYWERNLYNGVLAQQHKHTGMIAYFLPLEAGGVKKWGTPTDDFWCCHGTLVQAHALHNSAIYYEDAEGLLVSQYIPSELTWERSGATVRVAQTADPQTGSTRRPQARVVRLSVTSAEPAEFTLKLRLPDWLAGTPTILVNGEPAELQADSARVVALRRAWRDDRIELVLPKRLSSYPLADRPDTVAFMDGPVVLAGLCDEERALVGDKDEPQSILTPDNEREWTMWMTGYRTHNQARNIRFLPLYEIVDQPYTVYFPVQPAG
ncbi:MAG TPA: beta-L-arabinofuranosidase domain-containing protein [Roseiflexaceae bacterium]|nr:beta-L-arabinofuranosidase domain-containing protein [Roseiflexaceae bacterium]